MTRLRFASRYAWRHLLLSLLVGMLAAALVFGGWYPMPYRAMLGVSAIFLLLLVVDVMCGPVMTAILASPRKSRRERWLDFGIVAAIQLAALTYGLHSVWVARPAVLAFERDRLVVVTANEVDVDSLHQAPQGSDRLPWAGVLRVGTRDAVSNEEFIQSVNLGLAGVSPAMRPGWWQPWSDSVQAAMRERAKPLAELLARRPEQSEVLRTAAQDSGVEVAQLRYLPLTSSKTKDWVALLDVDMRMVGYAPVDGF